MKMDMTIFYFCHGLWVLWPPLIVLYARFYVDCVAAGCSANATSLAVRDAAHAPPSCSVSYCRGVASVLSLSAFISALICHAHLLLMLF